MSRWRTLPGDYVNQLLVEDKAHYSVVVKGSRVVRSIRLKEHISGVNRNYSDNAGVLYSWRAEIMYGFMEDVVLSSVGAPVNERQNEFLFKKGFENTASPINSQWVIEENLETETAMRVLLAMKLATSMNYRQKIEQALEIILVMSYEEVSFWVWKAISMKNKAVAGFKAMYLR